MKTILQSLRLYLLLTLLTGLVYPLALTGLARAAFPRQAGGSGLTRDGKLIGSSLLAQKFERPQYFWPRPSAGDFETVASGASNKGPTSADLKKSIDERRARFGDDAPIDLLTASASGLDPHISLEAALSQIQRVAAARTLSTDTLTNLVNRTLENPQLGFLGEPRVNVLQLNLALDALR